MVSITDTGEMSFGFFALTSDFTLVALFRERTDCGYVEMQSDRFIFFFTFECLVFERFRFFVTQFAFGAEIRNNW